MSAVSGASPDAYERHVGRYAKELSAGLIRVAGVRAGQSALDVGCGPGGLAVALAGLLGDGNVATPGGLGRRTRDRRRTCPVIGRRPPTPFLTPGRARRALAFNRARGGGSRQDLCRRGLRGSRRSLVPVRCRRRRSRTLRSVARW